jgi:AraC family transcriptional regulator of adaptative response / DNA-3-methyladenine glycosylase II
MLNGCRTTKIYCRTGCPPGRRTRPANRVQFASEAEALAAGYRACKVCLPDLFRGPWRRGQTAKAAAAAAVSA